MHLKIHVEQNTFHTTSKHIPESKFQVDSNPIMSLSARERILKLRETEFKLNKLQNDLISAERNGKGATSAFMSRFLEHHKELMSLPGRTRNSIPYRYGITAPKRYIEIEKPHRLTLPPKIDSKSSNRLKPFKEPELVSATEGPYGIKHPSLALQSLINELEDQTEKMAVAFPKIDRVALLKKTHIHRRVQPLNSMRYVPGQDGSGKKSLSPGNKTVEAYKAHNKMLSKKKMSTAILFRPKSARSMSEGKRTSESSSKTKLGVRWVNENTNEVSLSESRSDMSMEYFPQKNLRLPFSPQSRGNNDDNNNAISSNKYKLKSTRSQDIKELRETLAYAIESSNLMGVILPPKRGGPSSWSMKPKYSRLPVEQEAKDPNEDKVMSAKDALQLLRRRDRELPERKFKFIADQPLQPHQRGLIGVEISEFEPQCAVFYRDRNGNYNPHLKASSRPKSPAATSTQITKGDEPALTHSRTP